MLAKITRKNKLKGSVMALTSIFVNNIFLRLVLLLNCYFFSKLLGLSKLKYRAVALFMRGYRLAFAFENHKPAGRVENYAQSIFNRKFADICKAISANPSALLTDFILSDQAKSYRNYFHSAGDDYLLRLKYPRETDFPERQGDLLILKDPDLTTGEKGVILIAFTESFAKFVSIFDIFKIANNYRIILEPSWFGYQHVNFLFYLSVGTDVIIESPYYKDFVYIQNLNSNFYPLEIGAGDWVDFSVFKSGQSVKKEYDIVMVGNWSVIKRHKLLFKSLLKCKNFNLLKIALVGYESHGRKLKDVLFEAAKFGIVDQIVAYENITPAGVADILEKSKINVLLSKEEGANRGIYEGLFCGNVLILYENNKGVNRNVVNKYTGMLAGDDNLHEIVEYLLDHFDEYDTAGWARKNTGYVVSSGLLNKFLKDLALNNGEPWARDIAMKKNMPNLMYADPSDVRRFRHGYSALKEYLREPL